MQTDIVLCIDVGNTRLKWAVYKLADMSILQQSVVSDLSELSFADLNSCFAAMEPKPVWVSLVSSDDVKQCLSDWFEKEWKLSVNFIEAENQ
ncbi:MAG: type III pantothenate kinase, partial [Gammaproteobacteria bacterium]|nr:type III pantothenate kinase [Gammaproteobacteria bacterium]